MTNMNGSKVVNTIRKKGVFEMRESKRMKGSNIFNGDAGGKLFPTDDGLKPKPDYLPEAIRIICFGTPQTHFGTFRIQFGDFTICRRTKTGKFSSRPV
jgi:hypothetical protein